MKWGIIKIIRSYQFVPAMISVFVHVSLLGFLALCLKSSSPNKSPRHTINAAAYFKNPQAQASEIIPSPTTQVAPKKNHQALSLAKKLNQPQKEPVLLEPGDSPSQGRQDSLETNQTYGAQPLFRPYPQLVNGEDVKVPYPERARQLMIEGVVRLRLTISDAGRVIHAEVLSGPTFGLRNAALKVSRKLFFLPATDEHGQAKTAEVDHDVVFRISRRS